MQNLQQQAQNNKIVHNKGKHFQSLVEHAVRVSWNNNQNGV